jgi:SAM-dependent methyltransferase
MFLVSQERWRNAQIAEKQSYKHQVNRNPIFDKEFFSKNFQLSSHFFLGKDILEVGCSPVAMIHGIDNARSKVGVEPLASEWARFYEQSTAHIKGIGEQLPLPDESIDVILCINVLDHVKVPAEVLKEIRRCLKDESKLLLWLQTFSTFKEARGLLGRIDTPHPHHFNNEEVLSLIRASGYEIVFHSYKRANIHSSIYLIRSGMVISGLKSMLANLFLRLHESSFICTRSTRVEKGS